MNIEQRQRQRLLQCLVELREVVPQLKLGQLHTRFSLKIGICANVHAYFGKHGDESIYLKNIMRQWEGKATFTCMYPVGGPEEYDRESLSQTLWLNPRRLELLDWLIEELQK